MTGSTRIERATVDDRGAVMVEAAIGTGLFVVLLFAVMEFGMLFRNYLTLADLTRSGARSESTFADDPLADYYTLQNLKQTADVVRSGNVDYIVVFKATSHDTALSTLSATCAAGTAVSGVCNVYRPSDLNAAQSAFGCGVGEVDSYWCPTTRKSAASGPPDFVGVYVKVTHNYLTNMFGSSKTLTDQTIIRIEPQRL